MAAPMAAGAAARAVNKIPPIVPWVLATVGAWVLYSAVVGRRPLDELRAALTGAPSPGPSATLGGSLTASAAARGSAAGTTEIPVIPAALRSSAPPADLVQIGQGGHRLRRDAASAFAMWQTVFGQPIPVTDSWRDPAIQAAQHEKDPGRFAPADKSAHPKGLAVDVNLQAIPGMKAPSRGRDDGNDTWRRLYTSAVATGWCNPRGGPRGDGREPWHFSYGGCA